MNRIDDLIAELCPDGVEFCELGEVTYRTTNVKWLDVGGEEFKYIDLASVDRIKHSILELQTITSENAPSRAQQYIREGDVIFGTTRPMLKRYTLIPSEYDGDICSTGFCVLRPITERVLSNFIFHILGAESFYDHVEKHERGASYPAISDTAVRAFQIPVPPIEVQREIVKVLDTFTQLEAELEAELEARRRQYEYYRDALLSFDERMTDTSIQAKIKWMTLGEIGKFTRGRRFTKENYVSEGIPCIHYGDIYTHYGTSAMKTISHVDADLISTLRFAQPGDIVIASVGETVEEVGKAVAWLGPEKVAIHDDCFSLSHSMNPKFVSYYFQTTAFNAEKSKFVARAKVKRLSGESLAKLAIPVPPIEEQERIVSILEKFDTLVNDLSSGLPAEIEARRQQYEHYRDRLLTFNEVA